MKRSSILVLRSHSAEPMGMQLHEEWLNGAFAELGTPSFDMRTLTISSWRADVPRQDVRRVPAELSFLMKLPPLRPANRLVYGSADLYHRLDLRIPRPPGRGIVTVHDLPSAHFPDEGGLSGLQARSARSDVGVICPSEFAADEITRLLKPKKVWVIPNGVSPHLADLSSPSTPPAMATEPYVLCAGGATARKNLPALAEAWRVLKKSTRLPHVLIHCGPALETRQRIFRDVPGVRLVERQSPSVIAALMRSASAVVVPSVYEGFGLPALEGMAAGAPVVAVARGALPEVCGDAALLCEPDAMALCDGLVQVLTDDSLARSLVTRGHARAAAFTWRRAAEQTAAAYAEALAS